MEEHLNETSLDTLCAALAYAMGIEPPAQAAPANPALTQYIDSSFGGHKADRIFMYNPDAVAQWIVEKYPQLMQEVTDHTQLQLPMRTVMPSVTPVCFGTMYTGAQPAVHGIQAYRKPVIAIDSIFDALIRAGKKVAIVSYGNASMSKIYLERDMDYFIMNSASQAEAKAAQLVVEDRHDFIALYNGEYDKIMHSHGPESLETLAELRSNVQSYATFDALIGECWKDHRTLIGFAMDHGCHEIDDNRGSHGLDMAEDLNIVHFYQAKIGENVK